MVLAPGYMQDMLKYVADVKGIVHLNIMFSYMKFNKICNLDYPIF